MLNGTSPICSIEDTATVTRHEERALEHRTMGAPERGAQPFEGTTFWFVNPQGHAHAACLGMEIARVSDAGAGRCVARAFRHGNTTAPWKAGEPLRGR